MTSIVKIHRKGQMTLPARLRALAGIAEGDLVEAIFLRGKIVIAPKVLIDRSNFPNADDEYTPAQRRVIDARLDKADKDIKDGRVRGPFATAEEMISSLREETNKLRARKPSPKPDEAYVHQTLLEGI